jgi:hypothetical protein
VSALLHLEEPTLRFAHKQDLAHPKDGLTLFGPYAQAQGSLRFGIIGTKSGIALFNRWLERVNKYMPAYQGSRFRRRKDSEHGKLAHQYYPGFQSAFRILWDTKPENVCEIPDDALTKALEIYDRNTRVSSVVKVYAKRLIKLNYGSEHGKPDLWLVIIPRDVFTYCRPLSDAPENYQPGTKPEDAAQFDMFVGKDDADSFLEEYEEALKFKPDFHNQLKARLLKHQIITQILQEDTLSGCLKNPDEMPARDMEDPATTTWNLTTSIFYKTRRRPWILSDPREGVCYIGLVFKRLNNVEGANNACCGAQMFLEDGNGMVFKGVLGPWYSEDTKECHLDKAKAGKLLEKAIASYAGEHGGKPPSAIFIHGRVRFNKDEWEGFTEVAKKHGVRVTGVRISKVNNGIKLFRRGDKPVMRGTAWKVSDTKAYLWTTGFTPRLNTYPGWNVPNPLDVEICNADGEIRIETVLQDIMRLTKLNYNNCKFADGLPITLKFASKVGDILTTLPLERGKGENDDDDENETPLPFWHYI